MYHVLNRGVDQRTLYDKVSDILAFTRVVGAYRNPLGWRLRTGLRVGGEGSGRDLLLSGIALRPKLNRPFYLGTTVKRPAATWRPRAVQVVRPTQQMLLARWVFPIEAAIVWGQIFL